MPLRLILFLYLLLAPFLARAALPEVRVSEYHSPSHGRGLKLTFVMLQPDPALERFPLEEAREVVAVLPSNRIAADICKPGSRLNNLTTKTP
jgi:hypothetical protein